MKQHIGLLLVSLLCTACQSLQPGLPPSPSPFSLEHFKIIPLQPSQPTSLAETVLQVSKEPKAKGRFRVILKAGIDFQIQKTHEDVACIKLYLVTSNLPSPPQFPFYTSPCITKTSQYQLFTFSNVPGGYFYVAASAYDSSNTNITNSSGLNNIEVYDPDIFTIQNAFVSASGGDPGNPGRVTIAPITYTLGTGHEPTLGINLVLMPGS